MFFTKFYRVAALAMSIYFFSFVSKHILHFEEHHLFHDISFILYSYYFSQNCYTYFLYCSFFFILSLYCLLIFISLCTQESSLYFKVIQNIKKKKFFLCRFFSIFVSTEHLNIFILF